MRTDVSRPNIMKRLIILAFLLLPVGLYGENYPSQGVVKKVIDGDTIELKSGEGVRYIGIDAPETPFSRRGQRHSGERQQRLTGDLNLLN